MTTPSRANVRATLGLLILGVATWSLWWWLPAITLHRYLLRAPALLCLDVWTVLHILVKVAYVTADFVPRLNGEWDYRLHMC